MLRNVLRRRLTRRALIATAISGLAVTVGAGLAFAYWTSRGTGTATATTAVLNAATNVSASSTPGSGTAAVTWTASGASSGAVAPAGYYVTRYAGTTPTPACGTSPTNLITTGTSCSDSSIPDGTYTYVVTAVRNSWTAASSRSNAVAVSNTKPSVTVNQASNQADPTNVGSIAFTAVFSDSVTGFGSSGVTVSGSAGGVKTVAVTGSATTYTITVSGLTTTGTVTVSIPANAAQSVNGAGNTASTSTDNTVTFDVTNPTAPVPALAAATTYGSAPVYVNNETVTFSDAAADADSGVQSVSYYYCAGGTGSCNGASGTLIGTSTASAGSYAVSSNAPLATPDGAYQVVAAVTDRAGNVVTSAALPVAVDTANPTVSAPVVNGNS